MERFQSYCLSSQHVHFFKYSSAVVPIKKFSQLLNVCSTNKSFISYMFQPISLPYCHGCDFSFISNGWQSFILREFIFVPFHFSHILMFLSIQRSTSAQVIRVKMVGSASVCQVTFNANVHRDGKERNVKLVCIY